MRSYIIKNIFKKELKDIFRDKKTIFMMIMFPILLYPVIMLVTTQISMYAMNQKETSQYVVSVDTREFDKDIFDELSQKEEFANLKFVPQEEKEKENPVGKDEKCRVVSEKERLEERDIDAYIEVDTLQSGRISYKVYINSAINQSLNAGMKTGDFLEAYKEKLVYKNLKEKGIEPVITLEPIIYKTIDLAQNEEKVGQIMSMLLPIFLIIGILMGALYPSIDVMAGEKERGTIETLLTLPVSNLELIVGKFLAVATVSIMSALLNVFSIIASCVLILMSVGLTQSLEGIHLDFGAFIVPFIVALICILIFALIITAISMCICSLAKSFKEAQNYATPLMLIFMLPGYASMIPGLELTTVTACIPIVNIVLLIKSVLTFKYDIGAMALVAVSNFGFLILALVLLAKLFDSEEILFGSGKEFSILQRRYNITKGTLPTPSDSLIIYVVGLLGLIYIGSLLQVKLGFLGIALTQGVVIAIPLLFGWYIKTDFKKALSLNRPKLTHTIGAVVLWVGMFFFIQGLTSIILIFAPEMLELNEELAKVINHPNFLINIFVVAMLPAVCEEILFRGMIYKGLENEGRHPRRAIILSGILFGIMHLDFFRMLPTALLGIGLAYIVYTSGSIFLAMLVHFLNNGIVVVVGHFVKVPEVEQVLTSGQLIQSGVLYMVISILPLLVGISLLKKEGKSQNLT